MLSRSNDTSAPSALRADAVCILSRLCSGHKENQAAFRRDGGIVSLVCVGGCARACAHYWRLNLLFNEECVHF